MALGDKIRRLGSDAVSAGNPVTVLFGIVTQINPLEVNVDQRFTLDEDFLIMTELLTRYEITEPFQLVIREGLQVGDSVLLCRVQGGQKYVVWDKVVRG